MATNESTTSLLSLPVELRLMIVEQLVDSFESYAVRCCAFHTADLEPVVAFNPNEAVPRDADQVAAQKAIATLARTCQTFNIHVNDVLFIDTWFSFCINPESPQNPISRNKVFFGNGMGTSVYALAFDHGKSVDSMDHKHTHRMLSVLPHLRYVCLTIEIPTIPGPRSAYQLAICESLDNIKFFMMQFASSKTNLYELDIYIRLPRIPPSVVATTPFISTAVDPCLLNMYLQCFECVADTVELNIYVESVMMLFPPLFPVFEITAPDIWSPQIDIKSYFENLTQGPRSQIFSPQRAPGLMDRFARTRDWLYQQFPSILTMKDEDESHEMMIAENGQLVATEKTAMWQFELELADGICWLHLAHWHGDLMRFEEVRAGLVNLWQRMTDYKNGDRAKIR